MTFDGRRTETLKRRKPAAAPAIGTSATESLQAIAALPPEIREKIRQVIEPITVALTLQDVFNRRQSDDYNSLPAKHAASHLPLSSDPLAVGVPSGLANANAEGTANAFVRQDHRHKRDVRVASVGSDVGTRNRLNFIGAVVADDSVNDQVTITVPVPSVSGAFMAAAGMFDHDEELPYVIPGPQGPTGPSGTGGSGGGASMPLVVDAEEAEYPWVIPGAPGSRGDAGATGPAGSPGAVGPPGIDAEEPEYPYVIPGPVGPVGATGPGGVAKESHIPFLELAQEVVFQ